MRKIPAGQFKAQCLAVMDHVSASGEPVIITNHGRPVAKLVSAELGEDQIFGFMAGKGKIVGDVEASIPFGDWNLA